MSQPEFQYVEQPALDQLQKSGWYYKDKIELAQVDYEVKKSEAKHIEF